MLTNFYTDRELPIITVRTKFYPRQTQSSFRPTPHSKHRTLELVARTTVSGLGDSRLHGLSHRKRLRELSVECGKGLFVEAGIRNN